jgi:hypothetical protein
LPTVNELLCHSLINEIRWRERGANVEKKLNLERGERKTKERQKNM